MTATAPDIYDDRRTIPDLADVPQDSVPPQSGVKVHIARSSPDASAAEAYRALIGDRRRIPVLAMPCNAMSFPRDGASGFVLCRVDGHSSVDAILQQCTLPPLTGMCILCELVAEGIIAFRDEIDGGK